MPRYHLTITASFDSEANIPQVSYSGDSMEAFDAAMQMLVNQEMLDQKNIHVGVKFEKALQSTPDPY